MRKVPFRLVKDALSFGKRWPFVRQKVAFRMATGHGRNAGRARGSLPQGLLKAVESLVGVAFLAQKGDELAAYDCAVGVRPRAL